MTPGLTLDAAAEQPREREWTWLYPWRFGDKWDLWTEGLEQYTWFAEAVKIGRYGEYVGDEVDAESVICALRKRREVNLCLLLMEGINQRRLLDVYYRTGLSCDHRGWAKAASLVRVQGVLARKCPAGAVRCKVGEDYVGGRQTCDVGKHCQWDRDTFDVQVSLAVDSLWKVHEKRYAKGE